MESNIKTFLGLALGAAIANTSATAVEKAMEKCSVVKDGKGLIKARKSDCKSSAHSCAGLNSEGEVDAFIIVPAGECIKINQGDFSGVPEVIKEKINLTEK